MSICLFVYVFMSLSIVGVIAYGLFVLVVGPVSGRGTLGCLDCHWLVEIKT